jgi:hypothetical protein
MSKKCKNKLCVYCCLATSTTRDHIFSKKFFLETRRKDLPMAPACSSCNSQKSKLEHYLTAVLPFGALHADAEVNLKTMTQNRLDKNPHVLADLRNAFRSHNRRGWERAGSLLVPTAGFAFDGQKFEQWLVLVVKGLSWYHWQQLVTPDCLIDVRWGHENILERLLAMPAACRISENVGAGTFLYEAAQGIDNPQVSVWQFVVYGGIRFGSRSIALRGSCSRAWVLVGPRSIIKREESRIAWLTGRLEKAGKQ